MSVPMRLEDCGRRLSPRGKRLPRLETNVCVDRLGTSACALATCGPALPTYMGRCCGRRRPAVSSNDQPSSLWIAEIHSINPFVVLKIARTIINSRRQDGV
jgi:hypothetical protein